MKSVLNQSHLVSQLTSACVSWGGHLKDALLLRWGAVQVLVLHWHVTVSSGTVEATVPHLFSGSLYIITSSPLVDTQIVLHVVQSFVKSETRCCRGFNPDYLKSPCTDRVCSECCIQNVNAHWMWHHEGKESNEARIFKWAFYSSIQTGFIYFIEFILIYSYMIVVQCSVRSFSP